MKAFYAGSGTDDGAPVDRPVAQIDPVPRVSIQAFCESPELAADCQRRHIRPKNGQGAHQAEYGRRAGRGRSL